MTHTPHRRWSDRSVLPQFLRGWLPHLTLRGQVLASGMVLVLLISVFVFAYYPRRQQAATIAAMERRAESTANMVALGVGIGLELDEYRAVTAAFAKVREDPDLAYIVVFDSAGVVFAGYNPKNYPVDTTAIRNQRGFQTDGATLRVAVPIQVEGDMLGSLVLAQSLDHVHAQIARDRSTALLLCGLILAVAAVLSHVSASRIAAPIVRLKSAAERVAAGDYETPIHVRGSDEVGALEAAFASMQEAVRSSTTRIAQQAVELEVARDAAVASGRAKADFLATMSHEIRTPMNGVLGMLGLLLDGKLTPEDRDRALMAHRSAEALLTIINDILDFSKIEAGKLDLELIDFDLRNALEDVTTLLADRAQSKGLELTFAIRKQVPLMLRGDPGRLRQVLVNLVGNAIKFTTHGEVVIQVRQVEQDERGALIRFEIRDTGAGIQPAQLERLFEAFTQADNSTTRRFGGTGLGLAICRRLTTLMGGDIGAESTPGRGSTFWFTARFATAQVPGSVDVALPGAVRDLRILVVDDHRPSRLLVQQVFRSWNMHSFGAHGGARALTLLRQAVAEGRRYDVAIIDLMMPGMDGQTLAQAIKADPLLAETRLVLLTSMALRGQRRDAEDMGFDAYLTKPIRQSALFDSVNTAMQSRRDTETPIGRGGRAPRIADTEAGAVLAPARARLLLAEDNIINQQVALGMLEKLGYRADVVANGLEALESLGRLPYDLVLMDCQMSEMDGYEATREIRRRERAGKRIPVIAMTANAMEGDEERCLAAGMDGYITKPVSAVKLREALQRWIPEELRQPVQPVVEEALPPADLSPSSDPINLAQLRSIVGTDQEALRRYLRLFLTTMPKVMGQVGDALARQDGPALKRAAHMLKGACGNMGAEEMARLSAAIEKASQDPPSAAELWNELEASYQRTSDFARAV